MSKWKRPGGSPGKAPTGTKQPAAVDGPLIEPTPEEARNGWTAESLTAYVREREKAQLTNALPDKQPRPTQANSRYNPMRCWR